MLALRFVKMATHEVDVSKVKLNEINFQFKYLPTNLKLCTTCWIHFGQLVVNIDGKTTTVLGEQMLCQTRLRGLWKSMASVFPKATCTPSNRIFPTTSVASSVGSRFVSSYVLRAMVRVSSAQQITLIRGRSTPQRTQSYSKFHSQTT